MSDKKTPIFGPSDEISESIKIREQGAATETIDLDNLVSSQMTLSGSFDLRSVHESSLAKLLAVLPTPVLLVDHSQTIVFANDICANPVDKGKGLEGLPLSSIFTGLDEAMKFDTLIEMVFAQRKPASYQCHTESWERPIMGKDSYAVRKSRNREICPHDG